MGVSGLMSPVYAAGPSPAGKGMSDAKSPLEGYTAMCMQSVGFPAPYGEGDLKGNAKLQDYCKCFAEKFLERAMKTTPGAPASLEQTNKEEFAMRQSCRSQFNLPAPPKI